MVKHKPIELNVQRDGTYNRLPKCDGIQLMYQEDVCVTVVLSTTVTKVVGSAGYVIFSILSLVIQTTQTPVRTPMKVIVQEKTVPGEIEEGRAEPEQ